MKKSFMVSFPGTKKQNFLPCNVHHFCVKWRPPFGEILWRIAKMPGSYRSGSSVPWSIQIAQNARKKMCRTGVVTWRKIGVPLSPSYKGERRAKCKCDDRNLLNLFHRKWLQAFKHAKSAEWFLMILPTPQTWIWLGVLVVNYFSCWIFP